MAETGRWYKRNAADALTGMIGLSLEERGAYNTILDLIYARAGDLDDDDAFCAKACGCNVRRWKRLKLALVDHGKLQITNGKLYNERATFEISRAASLFKRSSEGGKVSTKSRASLPNVSTKKTSNLPPYIAPVLNKSKDLNIGIVDSDSDSDSESKNKKDHTKGCGPKKIAHPKLGEPDAPVKKLPVRWKTQKIPDEWREWCREKCPTLNVDLTEECFVGHWLSVPGSKGLKTKWKRVWMNWCREDVRRAKRFEPAAQGYDFNKLRE